MRRVKQDYKNIDLSLITKGELMRRIYTAGELSKIDSAIPVQASKNLDTRLHVMNYNENRIFGSVESLVQVGEKRGFTFKNK